MRPCATKLQLLFQWFDWWDISPFWANKYFYARWFFALDEGSVTIFEGEGDGAGEFDADIDFFEHDDGFDDMELCFLFGHVKRWLDFEI